MSTPKKVAVGFTLALMGFAMNWIFAGNGIITLDAAADGPQVMTIADMPSNGTNGATGATGATGAVGATGTTGAQGGIGVTGSTGPQGATGTNGTNGTNATLTISGTVSRTIQTVAAAANGFQIDASRNSFASYSVTINSTSNLTGGSAGYVTLEASPTNSALAASWIEVGRTADGQSSALIVGLALNQVGGGTVCGFVPAGYYARLRSVNTTGASASYVYNSGQETKF